MHLYFNSIFYRNRHTRNDNYKWLKEVNLSLIDKNEGKLIYRDHQFFLPKNEYNAIPLHQKYLYAALISLYDIPKYFLLFWDSLIIFNEIFLKKLYNDDINVRKDDIILDVGASIGWYACKVSKKVGNKGKIIAIEPNPLYFHFLLKNIELNNINNIIALNIGVWSFKTDLDFICKGYASYLRAINDHKENIEMIVKIQGNTIDNILDDMNINNLNLIKMDIEGSEIEALIGARNTLQNSNNLKLTIAAYHKNKNGIESYKILVPFLEKMNFKINKKYLPFIVGYK